MTEVPQIERYQYERIPFSKRIGGRTLDMVILQPIGGNGLGRVYPLPPGFASKHNMYWNLAKELAENGDTPILIGHQGASDDGVRLVQYAFESIEQGSFGGKPVPVSEQDTIYLTPHSLGLRKSVKALQNIRAHHDSRIERVIPEAAACLGGVRRFRAPFDALRSVMQEARYVKLSGVLSHHGVALDALSYQLGLGTGVHRELYDAAFSTVVDEVEELQTEGISFVAVEHPHDVLVHNNKNKIVYDRLGIPIVTVEVAEDERAGHMAQLYHPREAADAIYRASAKFAPEIEDAAA